MEAFGPDFITKARKDERHERKRFSFDLLMNHELALSLTLLEQASWRLRFQLRIHNRSVVKLLFPMPGSENIRFVSATTAREAEWWCNSFLSGEFAWFTVDPAEDTSIEWWVRSCTVEPPNSERDCIQDEDLWCVDLSADEYLVSYQWEVNRAFHDPDSHLELDDLEDMAAREGAIVWQGQAESNRLRVVVPRNSIR